MRAPTLAGAVPPLPLPAPASPGVSSVCIVTQALYPDILGGAPIGAHRLANALAKRGVKVEVHTVAYPRPPEVDVTVQVDYALRRHRFPRMPWDAIGTAGNPFAWRVAEAVRQSTAEVVHLRSHLFFTSVFGARGARRSGKPVVLSVHGVRAVRSPLVNLLQETWMRTFARRLFRTVDQVVCLTTHDREEVLRYGADPARTVLLWNAPDESLFYVGPADGAGPAESAGSVESAAPTEVVWLGRHVEEKGLVYLVEAWKAVVQRVPHARLGLIGDGPLRAEREEQVRRLDLQGSVRFEPFQEQSKVAARLRKAALFVLPSLKEGFPISVVEAMACGKPVVTTTGLEEIIDAGGITVPPRDAARLAEALLAYLEDPARRTRDGQAAARRATTVYGMDGLAEAYLQVYASAVRHRQERQKGRPGSTS